ncbi:ATP-binding cassette domain-containing protein [Pseudoalteromonas denitrificans]|uniref:ABC transporter n=1 Tax=Pseudoalteromonas denitrificans DSM 6059 TaxID=1123010 RepID=A0A1I1FHB1_9GAMM|nr:ATP-binding cassette domain-containing protein [Pseudoalteromonas denitrificans]SFB98755.1 ABC transporter [Pseudoalteromonas denitrificans DSM 6059]
MSYLLELKEVSLAYDDNFIFKNLDLTLNENEIITIKTGVLDGGSSLLQICNSSLNVQSGNIFYKGVNTKKLSDSQLFKTVGMQLESEGLLSMYTVLENCKLPISFHSKLNNTEIEKNIFYISAKFEFDYLLNKYPYQLNDVQLRLANLLRLLSSNPKIFLLDEIQSGMSDKLRAGLLDKLIKHLKEQEISLIMTITAGDMDYFADQKLEINNLQLNRHK